MRAAACRHTPIPPCVSLVIMSYDRSNESRSSDSKHQLRECRVFCRRDVGICLSMFEFGPASVGVLHVHSHVRTVTFTTGLTGALSANQGLTCTCPPPNSWMMCTCKLNLPVRRRFVPAHRILHRDRSTTDLTDHTSTAGLVHCHRNDTDSRSSSRSECTGGATQVISHV